MRGRLVVGVGEWIVAADPGAAAELGECLARTVWGEWSELIGTGIVSYTLVRRDEDRAAQVLPITRAIAGFLVGPHEMAWLQQLVRRHFRFSADEQEAVIAKARGYLHGDREHDRDREELAVEVLHGFLMESDIVVLDGVKDFLVPEIRQEFEDALDRAADEFALDREYREFIGVLRQYVAGAKVRLNTVHVLGAGNRFRLEDERGRRIGDDILAGYANAKDDGYPDDALVHALVTLAPRQVVCHQGLVDRETIETLGAVFDGRVVRCSGCRRCRVALTDPRGTF